MVSLITDNFFFTLETDTSVYSCFRKSIQILIYFILQHPLFSVLQINLPPDCSGVSQLDPMLDQKVTEFEKLQIYQENH